MILLPTNSWTALVRPWYITRRKKRLANLSNGAVNLHRELDEQLEVQEKARYFMYQEEPMYTKRESELLQQYIAQHGQMPEGNRELEDLF